MSRRIYNIIYKKRIYYQPEQITWQPRSPSPKIRSPSVTTITWIFLSGQFFNTSRIFPLQWLRLSFLGQTYVLIIKIKRKENLLTSHSNWCKDPEDAWICCHISGKPRQQLECKQLGATPRHCRWEVCRIAFDFSPVKSFKPLDHVKKKFANTTWAVLRINNNFDTNSHVNSDTHRPWHVAISNWLKIYWRVITEPFSV